MDVWIIMQIDTEKERIGNFCNNAITGRHGCTQTPHGHRAGLTSMPIMPWHGAPVQGIFIFLIFKFQ